MIATVQIDAPMMELIQRHAKSAAVVEQMFVRALNASVNAGGNSIAEQLTRGELGLTTSPSVGLASSVSGWMIDPAIPLAAVGVPSNSPAARHAAIHNFGGTIRPKNAKALAIPVSKEAKRYSSPRDMAGLQMIPRAGRPPLLVRVVTKGKKNVKEVFQIHWVLVKSVTLKATHWFDRGATNAFPIMGTVFGDVVNKYIAKWRGGAA